MAKKYVIYIDGKDLATFPVTQTESGKYYGKTSSGPYFKPLLKDFDNAKLPSGYKKYYKGSHYRHRSNPKRNPIDFSIVPNKKVTFSHNLKVISFSTSRGPWIKCNIIGTPYMVAFVHIYKYPKVGSVIRAGQQVGLIAPKAVSEYAAHLHIDEWTGYSIRKMILEGRFVDPKLGSGSKLIATKDMNFRDYDLKKIGTAKKNSVCMIGSFYKTSDGYDYYKVTFWDKAGCIADTKYNKLTDKEVTNLNGSKADDCEERVNRLQKVATGLSVELEDANKQIRERDALIEELEKSEEESLARILELEPYEDYYEALSKLVEIKKV